MLDQDISKVRVVELLVKFYVRLDRDGRVIILCYVRIVFYINKDDYIKVIIWCVYVDFGLKIIFIFGEDIGVIMRVGCGGMVMIFQKVCEEF